MIELKATFLIVWFSWFFIESESFCQESRAELRILLEEYVYNNTIQGEVNFKDVIVKNIVCSGLSQSLIFDVYSEKLNRIPSNAIDCTNYNDLWDSRCQQPVEPVIQNEGVPCDNFTIVDSTIPILPASFLSSFHDVVTLDLRSIHIETIKPGAFKDLTKLERLYLDGNRISVITHIFYFIDNLQVLTLSNNNITTVDIETFSLLKHLNYLDLSGNPIKLISNLDDSVLPNIQTLLLNNTLIDELNTNFTNNLRTLNLSSTCVRDLDFSIYQVTETLDFSHNQLVSIENGAYSTQSFLYLNHNNLSELCCVNHWSTLYLNISNNELKTITPTYSTRLQTLDASHNSISTIQNDSFKEMSGLLHLYLQSNLLTTIPVDAFQDLHALTHLDLSSNKIRQFQSGTFNTLANLEYLNIQHNQLMSIFQLNSLVKLNELYADHNDIKFKLVDLKFFKLLRILSFNHNPWSCENLVKVYHELKQNDVVVAKGDSLDVENLHGIACSDSIPVDSSGSRETPSVKTASNDESFDQFFNFDFYKSKFYKYFDEDYAKSNFFSYLRNYKFIIGANNDNNNNNNNTNEAAKLTSLVVKPENGGGAGALAVLNLMLLAIVAFLLSCLVYKKFVKDMLRNNQENIMMQDGLIA